MRKLVMFFLCLALPLCGQTTSPTKDSKTITTSGNTAQIGNGAGGLTATFEEVIYGSPASTSITVQGCMRGANTCDSAADTNTATSTSNRSVSFTKVYDYFLITASWTGGTSTQVTINSTVTVARSSSSASGTLTGVLGTANQITSDGSATTPTLSIPATFIFPGSASAATYLVTGATSGTATITASSTGGTLNLGSTNATVDSSGNGKFAGLATGTATVPAFNGANFPYISAPSTPAATLDSLYVDSTDLRLHDKNASGTIGTTSVALSCTNQVFSAMSVAGVHTCHTVVGADMSSATVTATQLAAQYSKGSCTELWGGSGTSFALTSGDDAVSNNSCYNDSGVTRTITAVKCRNDNASNTTTVNPTFGAAGTGTTILSGALTCGNSYAYSSSGSVSNASWTTGTGITPAMAGTLTGTSIAMIVEYTY